MKINYFEYCSQKDNLHDMSEITIRIPVLVGRKIKDRIKPLIETEILRQDNKNLMTLLSRAFPECKDNDKKLVEFLSVIAMEINNLKATK